MGGIFLCCLREDFVRVEIAAAVTLAADSVVPAGPVPPAG